LAILHYSMEHTPRPWCIFLSHHGIPCWLLFSWKAPLCFANLIQPLFLSEGFLWPPR
jgi:hypothetical protein